MGAITNEQLSKEFVHYVNIDKDNGGFVFNGQNFPGFEGTFLGIGSHTYEFKGRQQTKLDIFLFDEVVYQIEFGKYSWLAFKLLNQLMSIPPDELKASNNQLRLVLRKRDGNLNIFAVWNGEYLKWKYKFEELKFNGKDVEQKIRHRGKIIDKWYDYISELKSFDPRKNSIDEIQDVPDVKIVDDEDLPF